MAETSAPAPAPAAAPSAPAATPSAPASSPAKSTPSTTSVPTSSKPMTSSDYRAQIFNRGTPVDSEPSGEDAPESFGLGESEDVDAELPSDESSENELGDEPEAEDYSWAQELKDYKDGLHGVQLQELLKALQNGQLPDALMEKIVLDMKDGDRTWQANIKEMRDGHLRHSNYTRKLQEFSRERDGFNQERSKHQNEIKDFADYVNSWKGDESGTTLLAAMERMGMPFDKAARAYAVRLAEVERVQELEAKGDLPQGTADRLQRAHQNETALAQEKSERARLARAQQEREQAEQGQQSAAQKQQIVTAVKSESAKQFESEGLKMTQGSWEIYKQHLSAIWDVDGEPPTRQQIRDAVRATKEDVELYVSQHQAKPPAQAVAKAPQAVSRSLDGGAPKVRRPNPKQNTTSADYRKMIRSRG